MLYEEHQKRLYDRMTFEAGLRGIDLKKEMKKSEPEGEEKGFTFKSPEEYEKMSKDERDKLTQQMMGKHKLRFG